MSKVVPIRPHPTDYECEVEMLKADIIERLDTMRYLAGGEPVTLDELLTACREAFEEWQAETAPG